MTTKYFVDINGNYLGAFSGYQPDPILIKPKKGEPYFQEQPYVWPEFPENAIEVSIAPESALDKWDGEKWIKAILAPQKISTAQGHLALIEYGKYQEAVAFIEAIPNPTQKLIAEVNFYRRNDWQRDNETLLVLASALGISDAELDQMFIYGSAQ